MKKLIKRGFAALLALTLALGMSVSAFAVDGTAVAKKDYQLTNSGTTSPAETFQFTVKKVGVTDGTKADGSPLTEADMPNLTIAPVSYEQGGAGSADSKQPLVVKADKAFPNVGIYTYTVTEEPGDTAGVTYHGKTMTLMATVHYDKSGEMVTSYAFKDNETKISDIVNTYSAGALNVGKRVVGNLGDRTKKFDIKVTFTAPDNQTVRSTITYGDEENPQTITPADFENEKHTVTVTISLANEQSMQFNNVPYGVKYTVKEEEYKGYTPHYSYAGEGADHQEGTINTSLTFAHIDNEKEGTVDTGVILHSAPYILLLVGVGAAAVAFLILRKHREV